MRNDKHNDDQSFFNLSEAKWINRITGESLIHGEDPENPEKLAVMAKLLFEVSATIELRENKRTQAKVMSIEGKGVEVK